MSVGSEDIKGALEWVERETALRTRLSRMLSKGLQGDMLQMFSLSLKPLKVLEVGTFTGYSTICLSRGLAPGGMIDTIEINDELQDIIEEGFAISGIASAVTLHIGDAKEIIPSLDGEYDLVYIDANKREYPEYYNLVIDKVRVGGYILADNVLWDGKIFLDPPPQDSQTQAILKFNRIVKSDPRVEYIILPIRDGLGVIYKTSML